MGDQQNELILKVWVIYFFFFAKTSFFSNSIGLILNVLSSISTKSTLAPDNSAQFADATKELGEVQTISFFEIDKPRHDKCKALVALFTATENFEPHFFFKISSNLLTFDPWVINFDFRVCETVLISFEEIECCA